ncbi:hypothetical protein AfiDRAFT_1753 [Afipia sp. 1NLS2]|nr:hypothetical protein AfiDRAFT_1753 [Afipia sp. 1NLS2]
MKRRPWMRCDVCGLDVSRNGLVRFKNAIVALVDRRLEANRKRATA